MYKHFKLPIHKLKIVVKNLETWNFIKLIHPKIGTVGYGNTPLIAYLHPHYGPCRRLNYIHVLDTPSAHGHHMWGFAHTFILVIKLANITKCLLYVQLEIFNEQSCNVTRQWQIGNLQLATRGKDQRKYSQGICQLIPWCTFPLKKLHSAPLIMSLRMTAVWEAFLHWKLASAGKLESSFPLQFSLPNLRSSLVERQLESRSSTSWKYYQQMMMLFSWNISNFSWNSIFRFLQRTWIVQINSVFRGPP